MTTTPCTTAILAAALSLAAATAQSRNASLVARYKHPNETFYNDVWGYVDPATGDEYALLLGRLGTYVVDCSSPSTPVLRGFVAGTSSIWRDARTYRGYAFVVTEGSGGMQVIDLSNPHAPALATTFRLSGWGNSHNIALDTENGVAYACGTSIGTIIIDVKNPTSPKLITQYTTDYVHDLHIQNGVAHLAEINRSRYRALDVSGLPGMSTLGMASVPVCHNCWPTRDDQFVVATSETTRGSNVSVLDIRNIASPAVIATYHAGGSSTSPHNAYVVDRVSHMSYYSEGYRALDISDPFRPVEVAYYDTSSFSSGYEGNWGCFPFQPSGLVYASDMDNGLLIIRSKAANEDYGAATPGTGGVAPTLHTFGAAFLGNANFKLELEDARPSSSALFLLGDTRANKSLGGLTLLVETFSAPAIVVGGTTDGAGKAVVAAPVPNDAALDGLTLHAQAAVVDPNGSLGFAATAGKTFTVFQR